MLPATVALAAEVPEEHPSAQILGTERLGSGVVVDPVGLILTVNYVVLGARSIAVTLLDDTTLDGKVLCGIRSLNGHLEMNAVLMTTLARNLSPIAGRSVVDKTGLTGGFDAELTWAPDASLGNPSESPSSASDGPSLFTAIQEQLGLKLDAQRGPVDVLVIDSANRPVDD